MTHPTTLPTEPDSIDLSPKGVEAIVAALAAAGIEVHYTETDGDTTLDVHLRPVDEPDIALVSLSWRRDRRGWYVAEHDAAGVQQCTWPLVDLDLDDVAAEAARILAQVERAEAQMRAEAEQDTPPAEPATRTIKARYLKPGMTVQIHPLGELRTVAAIDRDGDTVHVRYVDTAALPYGVEEGVTVTGEPAPVQPAEPVTPEHTTPASLGAALRRAAADIEALGDIQLSPTLIILNLQAVRHGGTEAERKAAVDVLGHALAGPDATTETAEGSHRLSHWSQRAGGDDMWFSVYTGLDAEDGTR